MGDETELMEGYESWFSGHLRKIQEHPCYSLSAAHLYGRIHLPVAPICNIQCNYCIRKFDCLHESRPGVTSKVLSPEEALERLREVIQNFPLIRVIGIAGPGEPLANEETFTTLELVNSEFPDMLKCLSTNGLLLPDKIEQLHRYGVSSLTVTMNAVDPGIGAKIYSWVNYKEKRYSGIEGANILLSQQEAGIKRAVEREIIVKVNTVYIPDINGGHIIEIAKKARRWGASIQNIIPLIPQRHFSNLRPPTLQELRKAQQECGAIIRQMKHCRQCRADAVGKIGEDQSIPCPSPHNKICKKEEPSILK